MDIEVGNKARRAVRANPLGLPESELERRRAITQAAKRGTIAPWHQFDARGVQTKRGKQILKNITVIVADEAADSREKARQLTMGALRGRRIELVDALRYSHNDQKADHRVHLTTVTVKK